LKAVVAGVDLRFDANPRRGAWRPLVGGVIHVRGGGSTGCCPTAARKSYRCIFRLAADCNCTAAADRLGNRTDTG
jgi:hypothetical protein